MRAAQSGAREKKNLNRVEMQEIIQLRDLQITSLVQQSETERLIIYSHK